MRKLIALAALAIACLVAWNYFNTGTISVFPRRASVVEKRTRELEQQLDAARQRYRQAGRGAGIVGVDTTSDAEAARIQLDDIERTVTGIRRDGALSAGEAQRLERLLGEIAAFKREMGER